MVEKVYLDRKGNEIGNLDNIQDAFMGIMVCCGGIIALNYEAPFVMKQIKSTICDYMAARYCYKGATSFQDGCLNRLMECEPDLAKRIEYKLIN